jgi:hypothetical protein
MDTEDNIDADSGGSSSLAADGGGGSCWPGVRRSVAGPAGLIVSHPGSYSLGSRQLGQTQVEMRGANQSSPHSASWLTMKEKQKTTTTMKEECVLTASVPLGYRIRLTVCPYFLYHSSKISYAMIDFKGNGRPLSHLKKFKKIESENRKNF